MSTRLSLTGLSPSLVSFPKTVLLNLLNQFRGPNPGMHASRFGLFRFRSPLLTESHVVFSSSGYLDVSVHRVPFLTLCIGVRILEVCSSGFPHSEISGSKDICSSPKLIAAYHVFHRLLVPRHPPCALIAWPFAHHPSVGDAVFWFSLLIFVCSHRLNRCLPILRFNVCIKDIWLNFNQIYMYAVFKVHCITLTDILSVIRNLKYQISSI